MSLVFHLLFSLFLCLSVCFRVLWCVCVFGVCVVCTCWCVLCVVCVRVGVCGVWCGTQKKTHRVKRLCVYVQKRLHVYVQNASVCRFKTSQCCTAQRAHVLPHAGVVPVHTMDVLESTHGGSFVHTHGEGRGEGEGKGRHRLFRLPKFAHLGLSLDPRGFSQENPWISHVVSFRTGREQHFPSPPIIRFT